MFDADGNPIESPEPAAGGARDLTADEGDAYNDALDRVSEPVATVKPSNAARRASRAAAQKRRRAEARLKKAASSEATRVRAAKVGLRAVEPLEVEATSVPSAGIERIGPSVAEVAAMGETSTMLWSVLGVVLPKLDSRLTLTQTEVEVLSKATAPVLAKYLPAVASTPEAQLGVAVAAIFAPKIMAMVMEPAPSNLRPLEAAAA